jgi:hypothetical protein
VDCRKPENGHRRRVCVQQQRRSNGIPGLQGQSQVPELPTVSLAVAEPDQTLVSVCSLRHVSDVFRTRVLHYQAAHSAPVCQSGSLTLAHVSCQDVFLVCVVKNNANVVMALKWLDSVRCCCGTENCPTVMNLLRQLQPCGWVEGSSLMRIAFLAHTSPFPHASVICAACPTLFALFQHSEGEEHQRKFRIDL